MTTQFNSEEFISKGKPEDLKQFIDQLNPKNEIEKSIAEIIIKGAEQLQANYAAEEAHRKQALEAAEQEAATQLEQKIKILNSEISGFEEKVNENFKIYEIVQHYPSFFKNEFLRSCTVTINVGRYLSDFCSAHQIDPSKDEFGDYSSIPVNYNILLSRIQTAGFNEDHIKQYIIEELKRDDADTEDHIATLKKKKERFCTAKITSNQPLSVQDEEFLNKILKDREKIQSALRANIEILMGLKKITGSH